jgi:hypothetical protein
MCIVSLHLMQMLDGWRPAVKLNILYSLIILPDRAAYARFALPFAGAGAAPRIKPGHRQNKATPLRHSLGG